eukprot:TRINITY_DN298_c0_g1_i1.p1 TRINITY_DN298_c0_g1~~TRINITY_DN298_c0_g1_i1.p1  ORF type:complete len:231 (+),score=30.96 TRINITY_DN298_c0_g1_i1:55-747(+)
MAEIKSRTPLPENHQQLRSTLPLKPLPVTLVGRFVRLVPLDLSQDLEALFLVSNGDPITLDETRSHPAYDADQLIWRYLFEGPFNTPKDLSSYLLSQVTAPNGLCFTVFDVEASKPVGVCNLMNNLPNDLKVEIGGIWYSPVVQGSKANTEATYLIAKHVFDLGYQRLEWKCNALNERSKRTATRMGFKFEGIQEMHMIIKDESRDTAWFRILAYEWPEIKQRLEAFLYH